MKPKKNKAASDLGKLRWAGTSPAQRKAISKALHKAKKAKKKAEKVIPR